MRGSWAKSLQEDLGPVMWCRGFSRDRDDTFLFLVCLTFSVHQSPRSCADLKKSKSMLRSIFRLMMVDYCLQMFFSTQQDFEKLTPRSIKLTKDLFKWGKSKSKRTINTALRIASAELTLNPSKGGKRSTSTRKNFVRAKEETAWKLGTYWRSLHPLINATLNNVLPQPPGQSAWIQYSVWVSGSYILFLK